VLASHLRHSATVLFVFAFLAGACSSSAGPTTTVPPTDRSDYQRQLADQLDRIHELEQSVSELTEQLATVSSDLGRTQAHRDALAVQLAACRDEQAGIYEWVQQDLNRYQSELEQLRPLIPLPDTPVARQSLQVLEAFLTAAREGDYTTAANLYGGEYAVLADWNPTVDPSDGPALLQAGCQTQVRCDLAVRRILAGSIEENTYTFYVEFQTEDGQLFSLGPCCGSNTDPTVSQFPFIVSQTADGPRVLTLPIYVP
jgi:hypothetical protein